MTFDLLHELLNAKFFCFFHNCMWQSWHSEVNVYFLELSERLSTHGSPRSCLICVYVFVCVFVFIYKFNRHWHTTLDGWWSIHKSPRSWVFGAFATKQDIFSDLLRERTCCLPTGLSVLDNLVLGFGWIRWESSLSPTTSESNSFIQLSLKEIFGGGQVTHILSRTWFLQIPSQQLSGYNVLGVCRKGWLRSVLFDRTSIVSVEQAVYRPNTPYPGAISTIVCTMQDVVWSNQVHTDLCDSWPWYSRLSRKPYVLPCLNFVLPVSILYLWWNVNWLHIQCDKYTRWNCSDLTHCPVVKDHWDCVLNDLEELGDKEFLVLTSQYNVEIFSCCLRLLPFCSSKFHQTNAAKFVPKTIF